LSEPIKVSVILTSYNHAKYLREAIESVLNQTFTDFELIIWDDASTDESWAIIQSYTDLRIRAFRNEINQRGVSNVNRAISEETKGKYIAIHHSDDIWEPQKLEKQVNFLDENPHIGAVFSNVLAIGENGEPFDDESHLYYSIFDQPNRSRYEWLNFFFYHGCAVCHPSVLILRQCYDDCGLYRYGLAQSADFDMWVRLCLKYDIHVLPEKLIRFRVRNNEMNTSGNRSEVRIRWQFEVFQILKNYSGLKTSEEFIKVFPNANEYFRQKGFDIGFALGMVALESNTANDVKLLGLELLFEAVNDPDRARKINEFYRFSHKDFIALTAKYDVFSFELIADLTAQVAEKEQSIQYLTTQVAEKEQSIQYLTTQVADMEALISQTQNKLRATEEEVLKYALSKSWRITQPLREIAKFLRRRSNV
jgi:glycosyltransferase involved in cell wall biosynthesis